MRKYLILHILLFVFILTCKSQMYSTSPYIQQRPGFNTYQAKTINEPPSLGYSNGGRIGYSTYKKETFLGTNYYRGVYTPSYGGTTYGSTGLGGYSGLPRRSPGRPDPNNPDSVGDDWRMNNDHSIWERIGGWLTDPDYESYNENWPYYVDADYWNEFMAIYGNTKYGDYARSWYESRGLPFPGDPMPTPIDDIPVIVLICFICIYFFHKRKNE